MAYTDVHVVVLPIFRRHVYRDAHVSHTMGMIKDWLKVQEGYHGGQDVVLGYSDPDQGCHIEVEDAATVQEVRQEMPVRKSMHFAFVIGRSS